MCVIYSSGDGVNPLSRLGDDDDDMGDEVGKKQLVPRLYVDEYLINLLFTTILWLAKPCDNYIYFNLL